MNDCKLNDCESMVDYKISALSENHNELEMAKSEYEIAQERLHDAYLSKMDVCLSRMRNYYMVLKLAEKDAFVSGLEALVGGIERDKKFSQEIFEFVTRQTAFDPMIAKKTRQEAGLSQSGLAQMIGARQTTIAQYEQGGHVPRYDSKNFKKSAVGKYFNWLKKQGYNPYNI